MRVNSARTPCSVLCSFRCNLAVLNVMCSTCAFAVGFSLRAEANNAEEGGSVQCRICAVQCALCNIQYLLPCAALHIHDQSVCRCFTFFNSGRFTSLHHQAAQTYNGLLTAKPSCRSF